MAGCSDPRPAVDPEASASANSSISQSAYNLADIAFSHGTMRHHRVALELARLAEIRGEHPAVGDLASRIAVAQQSEIQSLTRMLEEWGEPVIVETGHFDTGPEDTSGVDVGVSMSDMAALKATSGAEFERLWLETMTEHYRRGVEMAETEIVDGAFPGAIDLARSTSSQQTVAIEEMQALLDQLGD
jgi:uncharacterized protein (DUF305 family)